MARPKKNNADYFTHDADMRNDVKIKAIRRKFGHAGYAAWNYLLEVMTDSDYFEIDWSELNQELLSADFDLPVEELREIVDYCVRLELLKSEEGKLFSIGHKNRLNAVLENREKQRENGKKGGNPNFKKGQPNPYYNQEKDNPKITGGYVPNEETLPKDKQSKVKESKVDIILSDNDSDTHPDGCSPAKKKSTPKRFLPPTIQQVEEYCRERSNKVSPVKFFNYYTSNGWKVGKNPMKDWKAAVRTWENNDYDNGTNRNNTRPGASTNEARYGSTSGAKQSLLDDIARADRERLSGRAPEEVPNGGRPDGGTLDPGPDRHP